MRDVLLTFHARGRAHGMSEIFHSLDVVEECRADIQSRNLSDLCFVAHICFIYIIAIVNRWTQLWHFPLFQWINHTRSNLQKTFWCAIARQDTLDRTGVKPATVPSWVQEKSSKKIKTGGYEGVWNKHGNELYRSCGVLFVKLDSGSTISISLFFHWEP